MFGLGFNQLSSPVTNIHVFHLAGEVSMCNFLNLWYIGGAQLDKTGRPPCPESYMPNPCLGQCGATPVSL